MNNSAKIDQTTSKIDAMHDKLDRLAANVTQIQRSVFSARSVAKRVFESLVSFSWEAQETMRAIIQSNWQMYRVLLEVQDKVAQPPTSRIDSNIKFENALGEYCEFPYDVFRHWEVSKGLPFSVAFVTKASAAAF